MHRVVRRVVVSSACVMVIPLAGCPAFHNVERDVERTPVVNTGAGASIIYPGQTAPPHPGNQHPRAVQPGGGQQSSSNGPEGNHQRSGSGSPGGGGGGVTMIGGSTVEEERHQKIEEAPQYWKYVTLPFAIMAAPFAYVYDAMKGEPEPGPELPSTQAQQQRNAPPPGPPPVDYESQQLEQMERELAQRGTPSRTPVPSPVQRSPDTRPNPSGGLSIADELAALRGAEDGQTAGSQPGLTGASPATGSLLPSQAAMNELAGASGHIDRDGDGRVDHWIFRESGQISRELFDEDFDGSPDRTLLYDLATHQVARIEEDHNRDGRADTWTALVQGQVVGRRADADEDGEVDTWTFYRSGVVTRIERDASGNGFRDHVALYEDGRLSREEKDDDGDGVPDLITHYDAQEQVKRVEEDANGDGHLDVVSHYEGGRLKSRELLDASLLDNGATR